MSLSGRKVVNKKRGGRTVSSEHGDGRALGASTTGTADTVDVILRVVGVVIVEHVSDVTNVLITIKRLASDSKVFV
jgi:hypothetical protein